MDIIVFQMFILFLFQKHKNNFANMEPLCSHMIFLIIHLCLFMIK